MRAAECCLQLLFFVAVVATVVAACAAAAGDARARVPRSSGACALCSMLSSLALSPRSVRRSTFRVRDVPAHSQQG